MALDRIKKIENTGADFKDNMGVDFEEYFEDIIGVSKPEGGALTKITLEANSSLAPYIKTKPLHGSQKSVADTDGNFKFTIEVVPNYELEKMLLSFGEDMTIIAPPDFKEKVKERVLTSIENFN